MLRFIFPEWGWNTRDYVFARHNLEQGDHFLGANGRSHVKKFVHRN